jgi:pimeloyl-ACP methyl ester carboxylesterase
VIVDGAAAGPPMVLLHGLGEDAGSWSTVQPGLARRHRTCAVTAAARTPAVTPSS